MEKIGSAFAFLALSLFLQATAARAQEVNASVDSARVEVGDSFTYTVSVSSSEMVRMGEPSLPPLEDMNVVGTSAGSETRSQIVTTPQGPRMSVQQIQRFNFNIVPQTLGKKTISGTKISVNGQTLSAPPVTVEVVPRGTLPSRPKPNASQGFTDPFDSFDEAFNQLLRRNQNRVRQLPMRGEDFFIGVQTDKDAVYVGEKLVVTYYLYTNGQVTDIDTLNYPVLDGFWKEDIEVATHLNFEPVDVNGDVYNRALLASYALYPLHDGILAMDSYQAKVGLLGRSGKVTNTRQSDPKKVFVQALPNPKPTGFLGVTGQFQVQAEVKDRNILQGQPFQFRLRFDGDGNAKAIKAPELDLPQGLKIYSVTDEAQFFRNGSSFKSFNYFIVASEPGQFTIPSQSAYYFDPNKKEYVELQSRPVSVQVMPSAGAPVVPQQGLATAPNPEANPEVEPEKWQPAVLASNPGWSLPNPPAAVWWGLYILSFLVLGVRGHRAFGLGQRKRSLQILVQRRVKELRKYAQKEDFRAVGAAVVNTTSFLLGQMSGVGGGGEQIDQLLSKCPPSVQREMAGELKNLMEGSQALSFAPVEVLSQYKQRDALKAFADRVERAWLKCLELGFQDEEVGPRS